MAAAEPPRKIRGSTIGTSQIRRDQSSIARGRSPRFTTRPDVIVDPAPLADLAEPVPPAGGLTATSVVESQTIVTDLWPFADVAASPIGSLDRVNDQLRRRSVGAPAARSTLLTVLGEYVLPAPDGAWQETLVSALNALDYKTQAARQALARSVSGGWLRTERHGRRSRVYLTDETARMLQSGAERIYGFGRPWEWDGRWLLVVLRVPEDQREVRHLVRTQLAWAGFGSLGNGLWITPHVEREAEAEAMARDASAAELVSFRAELGSLGHPARVIAQAWDLAEVADAYEQFLARFGRLRPKTPESVFRAQTELVHEWRRFPFLDPDLPEEMLPAGWPGSKARRVFEQQHAAWHEPAQEYFRSLDAVQQPPGRRAA